MYRLGLPGRSKRHVLTFGLHAIAMLATRLRGYRTLHIQDIDTSALVGMALRLLPGRRLVTTIHGEWPLIARSRGRGGRLRIRGLVATTDMFTSINPENSRRLRSAGVSPERIEEIPNGIDEATFRPPGDRERRAAREGLGLAEDDFVALYMGRLEPYKRVDRLLEAWSRLPSSQGAHLLIVGTGSQSENLRRQAADIESVRVDGPTDEPVAYLRAADVFVNASGDPESKWTEGLSVALLEAAFVGVLPIVTIGPGNDVIVKHLETGLNFPVGDVDGLVDRLALAKSDPELRSRLARRVRDSVVASYSATSVADQVAKLYRDVATRRQ